jgi:hypothetical protein
VGAESRAVRLEGSLELIRQACDQVITIPAHNLVDLQAVQAGESGGQFGQLVGGQIAGLVVRLGRFLLFVVGAGQGLEIEGLRVREAQNLVVHRGDHLLSGGVVLQGGGDVIEAFAGLAH